MWRRVPVNKQTLSWRDEMNCCVGVRKQPEQQSAASELAGALRAKKDAVWAG